MITNHISDRTLSALLQPLFLLYFVVYGIMVTQGFKFGSFNPIYLSIIMPIFLFDGIKSIFESLGGGSFYKGSEDLSKVTVIIPTLDGERVIGKTLRNLVARVSKENIIVASNGSTDKTVEIAKSYGVRVLDIPDKIGKVGAINMALCHVKTKYTLLMDDDVLIGKSPIPTQALDIGCSAVAFRVLPVVHNAISQIQMYEYSKNMDIGKKFSNRFGAVQNISGAIGLFHTKELNRQIEAHTGEFSGEDLQRTLLIHLQKNGDVVIADSIILTDVPDTLMSLINQRIYGWNPGLLSNMGKFANILFNRKMPLSLKYDAFYNLIGVVLFDPIRLISFPIMIFHPWYFVVMYLIYVGLEILSYARLKGKVRFWVVLVYPLYGLLNTYLRFISIGVFGYRRLTVYIDSKLHLDHYKEATALSKLMAISITLSIGAQFLFFNIWVRSPYFSLSREKTQVNISQAYQTAASKIDLE